MLSLLAVGLALAAEPQAAPFCRALAAAQAHVRREKPGPLPEPIAGALECTDAAQPGKVECQGSADLEKLRALWKDAVRELGQCVDTSKAGRTVKRTTDAAGALTAGNLLLASAEWSVEAILVINESPQEKPTLLFSVRRDEHPWKPSFGYVDPVTASCDAVKELLSLKSERPNLPGIGHCGWAGNFHTTDGAKQQLDCEGNLASYPGVVRHLDGCLEGWRRTREETTEARVTPTAHHQRVEWRNGDWRITAESFDYSVVPAIYTFRYFGNAQP